MDTFKFGDMVLVKYNLLNEQWEKAVFVGYSNFPNMPYRAIRPNKEFAELWNECRFIDEINNLTENKEIGGNYLYVH